MFLATFLKQISVEKRWQGQQRNRREGQRRKNIKLQGNFKATWQAEICLKRIALVINSKNRQLSAMNQKELKPVSSDVRDLKEQTNLNGHTGMWLFCGSGAGISSWNRF